MSVSETTSAVAGEVLVADDNVTNLKLAAEILGGAGYRVRLANDSELALRSVQSKHPDLLLLDIRMPGMDGFELCRRLKADEATRDIPVIFLASATETADKARAFELGAVDYVSKPVDAQELLARVGTRLALAVARQQLMAQNLALQEANERLKEHHERLEQRVAERTAELASAHEKYRAIFNQALDGIVLMDAESGLIVDCNPEFERQSGRSFEVLKTMRIWELRPRDLVEAARAKFREIGEVGSGSSGEFAYEWPDGTLVPVEYAAKVITLDGRTFQQAIVRDITERKRAEAAREDLESQLRVSQKMEAIGSLAGGVAHDFNNLLSVILNFTGFALEELHDGDPIRGDLIEVKRAGQRAAGLTRQLLAFSRKQVLQPQVLDLNQVVAGIETMLRRVIGEHIALVRTEGPSLGLVEADPGQLEQVIMNLAINARDAMPDGGTLTIETGNVDLDAQYAAIHPSITPGQHVLLSVTDTGCGMDEQTLTQVFEPFFTTKEKGKGTGLGLSTVYGIVKQSGGNIMVCSEPGRGTTFTIHLPRSAEHEVPPCPVKPIAAQARCSETVLVVEDEDAVRTLARRILAGAGYRVIEAANGGEALLACEAHRGEIHLLLTDVVMPRMSGKALVERLEPLLPGIKVLYMSGYTDDTVMHQGMLDPRARMINKPFSAEELTRMVRKVLDE
jgi:two-component system, cell cycle sensor histidine kinase and response regulator CckA